MNFPPEHAHQNVKQTPKTFAQEVLGELLGNSSSGIDPGTRNDIENLKRYYQEKVYLSYSIDSLQYLQHMLHKAQNATQDYVLGKVRQRQLQVLADIRDNKYVIQKVKEEDKLKKIRDQLAHKINDMKHSISNLQGSHLNEHTQEGYKKMMEFRQKGYWKEDSQQNKKVKKFLSKMKKEQRKLKQSHEKQMELMEKNIDKKQEKSKKEKEEQLKKIQGERIQRLQKTKQEREKDEEERKKRIQEANALVKKYKSEKPIYIMNAQKFKNEILIPMEEERKRKLAQWKKTKKPIDVEELQLHQQWYEQFKQAHNNAANKKQQDLEIEQKNMERLNELFHGRFHEKFVREKNPLHLDYEGRKKQRQKIMSYSMSVQDNHKPTEDPKKKQELERLKSLLDKKRQSGKKKVEKQDGSIVLQDITPQQRHMIGVSYLDHLRQFNSGRKKVTSQQKAASMAQLNKKPAYQDYLREQRISSQKTAGELKSRKNLRKIICSQGSSTRDRYESTMDHLVLLDTEAKRKETQLKYMRNGKRSMELKNELDEYYIESAYLNLKMLKQVVEK